MTLISYAWKTMMRVVNFGRFDLFFTVHTSKPFLTDVQPCDMGLLKTEAAWKKHPFLGD